VALTRRSDEQDAGLEFFAEEFEEEVADERGDDGDGEVGEGEDVVEGEGEGFAVAGGAVEFSHEEIGVEEEDDEGDLYHGAADAGDGSAGLWGLGHGE